MCVISSGYNKQVDFLMIKKYTQVKFVLKNVKSSKNNHLKLTSYNI